MSTASSGECSSCLLINSFTNAIFLSRFVRRNSQPTRSGPLNPARIMNMDEVPIPFEYLDGYTYEKKGSKSVAAKTDRSGWAKRQATLILYIFADGKCRVKPKIIFHGAVNSTIPDKEGWQYHPAVSVEFNPTAYNNEGLFRRFIDDELAPILSGAEPNLLVMDVAAFHKTDEIRARLRELSITTYFLYFSSISGISGILILFN